MTFWGIWVPGAADALCAWPAQTTIGLAWGTWAWSFRDSSQLKRPVSV
jgi:hypothetical protein